MKWKREEWKEPLEDGKFGKHRISVIDGSLRSPPRPDTG